MTVPDSRPSKSARELRVLYRELAPWMDGLRILDRLLLGRWRLELLSQAHGRVLEVACGAGTNLPFLPVGTEYVGADLSRDMLRRARRHSMEGGLPRPFLQTDAQHLPFADHTFDTVCSALSTCTFPDPVAALREMGRVVKPHGRILLLEHGRSRVGALARLQDRLAPRHFERHGCRWNQDPARVVARAGLPVLRKSPGFLGILVAMQLAPSDTR